MKLNIKDKMYDLKESNFLVIGVYEDQELENVPEDIQRTIRYYKSEEKFKGTYEEVIYFTLQTEKGFREILLLGLGKEEELSSEKIRKVLGKAIKKVKKYNVNSADLLIFGNSKICLKTIVKAMTEGIFLSNYQFDKYKGKKAKKTLEQLNLVYQGQDRLEEVKEALEEGLVLAESTILARNLVNEPANVLRPRELANEAIRVGEESGFQVEILEKDAIETLGMKAFLEVARGSINAPKLIVMRYFGKPENKEEILGLVGKGLTYDSGGYSIKSNAGMVTMKSDMGGAAAVIGAMAAIAKRKLNINVIGVIAACENVISGGSYKPGDIIGSMAGKTIEVLNTDAEGRLTLADAVYYTVIKEKATNIIDLATLTGAVLSALGTTTTGVVTNNQEFYKELEQASKVSGEKVWQLPSFEEYKKLIISDIADLKNVGGKNAGTITAGLFIGEFVEKTPWMHLDIAGTAWADDESEYISKGGTGVGVRTLYYLAKMKTCGDSHMSYELY